MKLGISIQEALLTADPVGRRHLLGRVAEAGLDHVTFGDHLSFHGGIGFDGLVSATAALCAEDTLDVLVGVYLAGLRHPVATARMLSTISQLAPGRLVLGVGAGGEDRSEISNAGVDPKTRGRRLDETLEVLRRLATGESVDHRGEFFTLSEARILPAPVPRVPIVIGGSGDAAVRRTAAIGDGWLGIFCSPRRYQDTVRRIRAAVDGRSPSWFGLSMWCGFASDGGRARELLGARMESLYRLPAAKFEHVTAAGTPEAVAEQLAPYLAAGAVHLTLVPVAASVDEALEAAAEVRRLLLATSVTAG
ncbi:LLM class flavin-dependent oxidoreductase [Kribbella sp. DT2]|uniref:LLM class flavin-dependent oxidoreductase n=1 Tax=Kribbella sp. DT2 TaxID=3393427 RepID=UPI003CFAD1A0